MFAARNMLFARSSAFDPLSLSPALWLSDTGSDPGVWPDLSGNGRHATQATAAYQPSIVTGALNGRQVRRFDGGNDLLSTSAIGACNGLTIFVVEKKHSYGEAGYGRIVEFGSGEVIFLLHSLFTAYQLSVGALKYSAAGSADLNTYRIASAVYASATDSGMSIYLNGSISSQSFVAGAGNNPSNKVVHIGNRPGLDRSWDGDMAEILVFPTALSTADRQQVENYLNAKWAIY